MNLGSSGGAFFEGAAGVVVSLVGGISLGFTATAAAPGEREVPRHSRRR